MPNLVGAGNSPGGVLRFGMTPIPPHALGAFTLFLRLPGYAETLFMDTQKACSLLRLALGVNDGLFESKFIDVIYTVSTT